MLSLARKKPQDHEFGIQAIRTTHKVELEKLHKTPMPKVVGGINHAS